MFDAAGPPALDDKGPLSSDGEPRAPDSRPSLDRAVTEPAGWSATLDVIVERTPGDDRRSVVRRRRQSGPLQLQRPFYPEGPARPHVYLLHPPGGLVSGDDLHVRVEVATGARALLTTPAATKLYRARTDGSRAVQRQTFTVAEGAQLEWLPQETIAFTGARARLSTCVHLAASASFVGWEIVALGRAAAGDAFTSGVCEQRLEVWRNASPTESVPLLIERTRLDASSPLLHARWGLAGRSVVGTFVAVPPTDAGFDEALISELTPASSAAAADDWCSLTHLEGVLVARVIGRNAERARATFARLWARLRLAIMGVAPIWPRVWST